VPTGHPLHAGLYDPLHPAVRDADVLAFLGCRLFTEFEAGPSGDLPASARLVHLYADPVEVGRLHPVDAPLTGDPALALVDLLAALPADSTRHAPVRPDVEQRSGPAVAARFPGHVGLAPVVEALAVAVEGAGATVVLDATTATVPLLRGLRTTRPGQLLSSTSGSLGWGMGAALGVQLAAPGTPVLALLGDGSLQFGLPALWTAQRYGVPVTYVVLNNRTYSAVASALSRFDGAAAEQDRWPGTDIGGLDIAAVAAAFGVPSRRVTGAEGLAAALATALSRPGPSLIEVLTGPGDHRSAGAREPAPASAWTGGGSAW
jgi:benzoylformate decarboxylase